MKHTHCEYMIWHGLPFIRRGIAECITKKYGLSQKETAKKMGVTPSAICQYLSKKRGNIQIIDEDTQKEISTSAKRIIEDDRSLTIEEICRICKIMRSRGLFPILCDSCDNDE